MPVRNQVQLITYPDSMGGNLSCLYDLLVEHFPDTFGGIHILPPFPSSGDRGFAPRTYFEIDPVFGTWEDIQRIGARHDVLLDLMVNHLSRQSSYFQDFARRGRRSPYADMFLTLDKVWLGGNPIPDEVAKVFLRRPEHPFTDIRIQETGETERVWATFGTRDWSEQIDLDVHSPVTRQFFTDIFAHMSQQGVKMMRLDAIAFVTKKRGTSCFFVEPEIYDFIDWITEQAQAHGIELLPEVHSTYPIQRKLSEHGCWVYNFVLPLLILHTLMNKTSLVLHDHLRSCPPRQFTMLDCHDGIPVQPDLDGILEIDDAQKVVQACIRRGANLNRIFSVHHRLREDFDAHQINCTYYSALGEEDDAYLAARAIQFFSPGIPQVYYTGLLAGENDQAEVERSGEGRGINRHNFTMDEVKAALQKPAVQRLLKLIRFRNEYPAFGGDFQVLETGDQGLGLCWEQGEHRCAIHVDLDSSQAEIEYRDERGETQRFQP